MSGDGELPPFDPFARNPDRRYELRAADLLRPLLEPGSGSLFPWRRQTTNAPIVSVEDAYITGLLDLRAADLNYLFRFERCRFEYPPDVREAKLLGLVLRKCWLPGLKARNLRSRNDVRLIRSIVQVGSGGNERAETTVGRGNLRERGMPDAAVNLTDAVVEGSVVLTRTRIVYPSGKAIQADRLSITGALLAYRLEANGEVRVPGLRTGGNVNFSGASLRNPNGFALNGNGLHIGGSLLCEVDTYGEPNSPRRPFSAEGVLFLPSARVDSDIVFRGAELHTAPDSTIAMEPWRSKDPYLDPRPALFGDRLRVDGNVELSDGLTATGTVRMVNARIGGSLRLASATITVPRNDGLPHYDRALHLDGSEIDGDIEASNLNVPCGQLRLADVTVGGNLLAGHATLSHPDRDVFSARRLEIAGNLLLTDADVHGTLRLQGVHVGGSVELYGSQLREPAHRSTSFSLDLRTARIGRDVLLTVDQQREFLAEGGVTLDGATVGRRLNLGGAVLRSLPEHGVALDAADVTADEFLFTPAESPQGRVVLRRAQCGTLDDNPELWQSTGGIELEDFRYEVLANPIEVDDDAAILERIRRLHSAIGRYQPGPYDQLAAMLRASGNEEHADTVLLRKQQYRYEALASGSNRPARVGVGLWSWLQRWMVGYGYRPVRALGWLGVLLVLGSLWFGLRQDDCVNHGDQFQVSGPRCAVNRDDSGLQWNPVLYTADLLVPIIDFGNKSRWYMSGADRWVSTGMTATGWILATTVAAGATRIIRRPNG